MSIDYQKEIVQRITKNLLDIQLLRVLETEPMWGYKIKKTFEAESGIKLRHGALYPTLNWLEHEGFLVSEKQRHNGRGRKTYTLTPKGKEFLESYYAVLKEQMKNKTKE
jgi:PadR family transcriptional regulator, regulatory protein PadR